MALLEQIGYEAALRALDKQEALVAELRARSGVLLAVASVAIPFAGPARGGAVVLVLAAYVIAVACGIFVLLPKTNLRFALSGPGVIDTLQDLRGEQEQLYRRLTFELDDRRLGNDAALASVLRAYHLGSAALVGEVVSIGLVSAGTIA